MTVGKRTMETTYPHKHSGEPIVLPGVAITISQLYFIWNYWTIQTLQLIVADVDTQSTFVYVGSKNVLYIP